MMPIGSSSRTTGRLVITVARSRAYVVRARSLPCGCSYNVASYNGLTVRGSAGGPAPWSLRHARRRVELTLRFHCDEARSGFGASPASDPPAAVLALERFGPERDDLARRRDRQDDVHPAGTGAGLELRDERAPVRGARRSECGGVDHHEARRHVREPAAKADDEGLKAPRELLHHGPALSRLDGTQVVVEQEHLGIVGREEQRRREGGRSHYDHQVSGLEAAGVDDQRAGWLEAPVHGLALGGPQPPVLLAPPRE